MSKDRGREERRSEERKDNCCCALQESHLEKLFLDQMRKIERERRQKGQFINFAQIEEVRQRLRIEDLSKNLSSVSFPK